MAYKSLYRAYRPQTFEDVSGQEAIITTLRHAVSVNRIAHAYLFCGPRGTGKTTIAKLLAKAINCTEAHKPCGVCENCKAIEDGTHPDVIEIDAASNNGVEEVRDLIDKVKYAPTMGRYKVYIIDEVHMMSSGAFNALLKTLEEPPAHVVFILATTEPHKILPTIISRCQRFDFSSLTIDEMVARMQTIAQKEHKRVDEEALNLIAKLANGGMRDALSILEQCLAYNDEHLTADDVNAIYGMISMIKKIELIKVLLASDMNKALDLLQDMDHKGIDVKRLTYDLVDILKDVVIYRNTQNAHILTSLTTADLNDIVPYISSDEALSFIDILMETSEKYARALNPHVYFELAVLKLCNQDHAAVPELKVKDTQPQVVQETPEIETAKVAEPEREPAPAVQEEPEEDVPTFAFEQQETDLSVTEDDDIQVDIADIMNILVQANKKVLLDIQEKWQIIRRYIYNQNTAKSALLLSQGKPVAACEQAIVLAFEFMPDVNAVNNYKNYRQLSALIKEIFAHEYRFVAMQEDEWLKLRSYYIQQARRKTLPTPGPIVLKHIDQYQEDTIKLNDAQQFAIDLFGNDIVEFVEED